ncbi:hypothetical protein OOT00_06590 [Desulfobotulus sp. H1]|uniref:Uncharacterized protein n=1 Tax=Desulfobotulus pelophilus TaxID=2823377 RepID=A0ABT3N864_9BACT|nr:hypothetical protein [Desulfobotulus pelophilus]MCW7753650.1 hypothetical protein [Desulfobotulus pelophilus]
MVSQIKKAFVFFGIIGVLPLLFTAHSSGNAVDGAVRQGQQTYYCEVYNSTTIRAHIVFVEYMYQHQGQWFSMSRSCDPNSGSGCEISPGGSLLHNSNIRLHQYPISHCRAHLGGGRW